MTPEPTYILRTTRIHVMPEGKAMFDEAATVVEIADHAGGEFIKISQDPATAEYSTSICINDEAEWNAISAAVQDLFHEIAKNQPKEL